MTKPEREIRAFFTPTTIRVYQAYSDQIADSALRHQTFISPPFSMTRMTWIKPSFLWMMYRAGWGQKDDNQKRILAIDITHDGFAWALENSCPSHAPPDMSQEQYRALKDRTPVRIQWDPERNLHHAPLQHRAIQIGLTGEAVTRYAGEWITQVHDVTTLARDIQERVLADDLEAARAMLPLEKPYIPTHLSQ
ncbi:MAG: DUF4291 domain-containing protein [Hyphomonadaceae bacterium]